MSIERIRNYIIENAQKEAGQIVKTAEEQSHAVIEDANASIKRQYHEMLLKEEKGMKEDMEIALNTLRRNYRMKLLGIKNTTIDDVLMRAINRIQSLPDNDYLALMGRWLSNIPDHSDGQLFFNARDLKRITLAFTGDINKNRKAKISLNNAAIEIKGGFILKTHQYEIDCSLDTLIKNLRGRLTPKLDEILHLSDVSL